MISIFFFKWSSSSKNMQNVVFRDTVAPNLKILCYSGAVNASNKVKSYYLLPDSKPQTNYYDGFKNSFFTSEMKFIVRLRLIISFPVPISFKSAESYYLVFSLGTEKLITKRDA